LVPSGGILPARNATIPLHWKVRLPCDYFEFFLPLNEYAVVGTFQYNFIFYEEALS
jgi:hypothetical protein